MVFGSSLAPGRKEGPGPTSYHTVVMCLNYPRASVERAGFRYVASSTRQQGLRLNVHTLFIHLS
eukprot:2087579-Prymnesium_polylepis.1